MHAMSSSQIRDYSECVSMFKCKFMCVCLHVCVCVCVYGVEESGSLIASARLPTLKWPLPQGRDSWLYGKMERGGESGKEKIWEKGVKWEGRGI